MCKREHVGNTENAGPSGDYWFKEQGKLRQRQMQVAVDNGQPTKTCPSLAAQAIVGEAEQDCQYA